VNDIAIAVDHLAKIYRRSAAEEVRAVDDLSFTVRRGSIFGLLGPNGAGKTTTLKILTTLARPTSGRASVLGHDVVGGALDVRKQIGVVIQEQAADLLLSVRDNLMTFARFHGHVGVAVRQRAESVIEKFGLESTIDAKVADLTQILTEAEELCDDILIINKGRAIARGDLHHLKTLVERLYDVTLSFEQVPADLAQLLEGFHPADVAVTHNTVRLKLRDEESRVLELVMNLAKRGRLLRIEINGASLEDIFVELTQKSGRPS
jgi:ABC-type multidrug transport system ATPase subunit